MKDVARTYGDSSDVAPMRCSICIFGKLADYTINTVAIEPMQHHLIERSLLCYEFKSGKRYRVQFSIDTNKTGLRGKSDWYYFTIP